MRSSSSSSTMRGRHPAHQVDGVLGPRQKAMPVEVGVAPQEVGEDLGHVLLGGRHELGLVVEGALAEGEPDRDEVLLLALEPQVPPVRGRAVGRRSWRSAATRRGAVAQLAGDPGVDRGAAASASALLVGQVDQRARRQRRSAALDEALGGSSSWMARSRSRPGARCSRGPAAPRRCDSRSARSGSPSDAPRRRRRRPRGRRLVDQEARSGRGRPGW